MTTQVMGRKFAQPGRDILGLLQTFGIPEIKWTHGDDLCDCTFQQIGEWTNPYIARTLRVRWCCILSELMDEFPQFVQEIPAYYNENTDLMEDVPQEWNVEDSDMPRHLFHRQLAVMRNEPISKIRRDFADIESPKAVPKGTGVKLNE